jgi:predicted ThiF/HesA family dinucleotide-utilizing enzyme
MEVEVPVERLDPSKMRPRPFVLVLGKGRSGKTVLVQDLLLHQRHGRDPAVCVVVGNQNAEYDHLSLSDLVIKAYYGYVGLQHACTALHGWAKRLRTDCARVLDDGFYDTNSVWVRDELRPQI